MSSEELLRFYGMIMKNWRFQVNSNWQRTNYFAVFGTALIGGAWKIISAGYVRSGIAAVVLGMALTGIWLINDVRAGRYIAHWWASLGSIETAIRRQVDHEGKEGPSILNLVSSYDSNAWKYHITRPCWPTYRGLMRMVPGLFFAGWFYVLVFAFKASCTTEAPVRATLRTEFAIPAIFQILANIATVFTAVGVWFAWKQIDLVKRQAVTSFEDGLTEHYRSIMKDIPVTIWLGSSLETLDEQRRNLCQDAIYRYIDLCQEQAVLYEGKRITIETWSQWGDGIKSNMKLRAFQKVWNDVKAKQKGCFLELEKFLSS